MFRRVKIGPSKTKRKKPPSSSPPLLGDLADGGSAELESCEWPAPVKDRRGNSTPSTLLLGGGTKEELYVELEKAIAEESNSRRDAFEESMRRMKALKDVIDTIHQREKKDFEEALAKGAEDLEKVRQQVDAMAVNLRISLEERSALELKLANSNQLVLKLEQNMVSAVEQLAKYKEDQEDAIKQEEDASKAIVPLFFSISEIEGATSNFDPSLTIGEGGYGIVYKGFLRHTQVAIKKMHSQSLHGPPQYQQEVTILGKLRHPNLVTLIGACPEAWVLVYEYLPNGSLEDRLSCRDNTPPLSWKTRIRIASELCSALIFLHSDSIVHGDLKPSNILLDANYVCKLSDFGTVRVMSPSEFSTNSTLCHITVLKGTLGYIDPEFVVTGELTPKSDVYSFGVILLRLLTGKPALGIPAEMKKALDNGKLKELLDPTVQEWPFVQAQQLAHLAMRCCDRNRGSRPDLTSEVWGVLESMRVACDVPYFRAISKENRHIPPYFICPIFQEIMQDPHIAADGYTYELEAMTGWLDSGHDTSPMTNLQLLHGNLVPNRALRSAIQEWLQQQQILSNPV